MQLLIYYMYIFNTKIDRMPSTQTCICAKQLLNYFRMFRSMHIDLNYQLNAMALQCLYSFKVIFGKIFSGTQMVKHCKIDQLLN